MKKNSTILILLSAGLSHRFNRPTPKQYNQINNKSIILASIEHLIKINEIDYIQPVINIQHLDLYQQSLNNFTNSKLLIPVFGGESRGESVLNGLKHISLYNPNKVLIHDCARIYPSTAMIVKLINSIEENIGVIPALPISDTMVKVDSNYVKKSYR